MAKRVKLLDWKGRTIKILGEIIPSVNPYNGCNFNCYNGGCWAKIKAQNNPGWKGYRMGFKPNFVESRLTSKYTRETIRDNDYVWIGLMGEFYFQSRKNVDKIIDKIIKPNKETIFVLSSKKPSSFKKYIGYFPRNILLGTTIETNRNKMYKKRNFSKAPAPKKRYHNFKKLNWKRKYVSIEPYMDFDLEIFVDWIKDIGPEIVSIGPDSQNNGLPEPSTEKALELLKRLSEFTRVEPKRRFVTRMWHELDQYKKKTNNSIYADLRKSGYLPSTKFVKPKKKAVQKKLP